MVNDGMIRASARREAAGGAKRQRLRPPQIIGLTGSIGMGKTTVAKQLTRRGDVLADADAIVHQLLLPKGTAFSEVSRLFPDSMKAGMIDRGRLGMIVFADRTKLKQLEKILHPKVRASMKAIIRRAIAQRRRRVILEIPLLYETGADAICDQVVVVTAPAFIQRQRVMARPGMTKEKFREILAFQLPDREKRKRADVIIPTGLGRAFSQRRARLVQAHSGA